MTNLSGANLNNGAAVGPQGEGRDSPSTFPKYPAYKDSGVEWLGDVPGHWNISPLKFSASCNDTVLPDSTDGDYEIEYVEISDVNEISGITGSTSYKFADAPSRARRMLQDGDVLVSTVRTYLRAIAPVVAPPENLIASTGFAVVRPRKGILDGAFLGYMLRAEWWISEVIARSVGVSYPAINASDLIGLNVPVPAWHEQTQIARFLDHETARIDALIEEQQRLIELLKEKRQAVISHAVTKGLDPTAPMKESEISYLDKSPIHWRLKRLGDVVAFAQGKAHEPYIDDDGDFICVNSRFVSTEGKTQKYCSVNLTPASVNDILMVMSDLPNGRALARAYYVIENGRLAVNQRVCRITAEQANSRFLFYLLNRHPGLMQNDDGVNQTHLSNSDFQKLRIFLPPLSEQLKIAHYLDHVTVRIDSLISEAVIGVGLLQERRSALISAAVTGKIDVRGWRPPARTQAPKFEVAEAV
jgi:type I restriction enzyme S subunit